MATVGALILLHTTVLLAISERAMRPMNELP